MEFETIGPRRLSSMKQEDKTSVVLMTELACFGLANKSLGSQHGPRCQGRQDIREKRIRSKVVLGRRVDCVKALMALVTKNRSNMESSGTDAWVEL